MDPAQIHDKYGDKLCLHGTISVQSTLPFGSRDDVVNEVRKRIERIGLTGIILGPTHAIQPDAPLENILTLLRQRSNIIRILNGRILEVQGVAFCFLKRVFEKFYAFS